MSQEKKYTSHQLSQAILWTFVACVAVFIVIGTIILPERPSVVAPSDKYPDMTLKIGICPTQTVLTVNDTVEEKYRTEIAPHWNVSDRNLLFWHTVTIRHDGKFFVGEDKASLQYSNCTIQYAKITDGEFE